MLQHADTVHAGTGPSPMNFYPYYGFVNRYYAYYDLDTRTYWKLWL